MKNYLKKVVVNILSRQVKKLRKKHNFVIIGVVGSVGKTSTKLAIAQVLGSSKKVRYQSGNYNDIVSVPLVIFGHEMPSLMNPLAWLKVFIDNSKQIRRKFPYDIVVLELGTDKPGDISEFAKYLELDIAVVTSVAPEHMEFFKDIDAVAKEELTVANYCKKLVYNADLVDEKYLSEVKISKKSYSLKNEKSDFYIANLFHSAGGYEGDIKNGGAIYIHFTHEVVSETQLYSVLAATAVCKDLGVKNIDVVSGIAAISPVSGRLRRLNGIHESTIIDDTYNASPEAVKASLRMLQGLDFEHRIAILGNMNELGAMSADAHKEIGNICEPSKLELVLTLGPDANKYLASAAKAKGCTVVEFNSPYKLGEYLAPKVQPGTVILAKGSQNGVFAEEAVKILLAEPEDSNKLVRQNDQWLKRKKESFKA